MTRRLLPALLLGPVLLLAPALPAHAQVVGKVLLAVGDVSALRKGSGVPLRSGSLVELGDTLRLGASSTAQVRFTDGGIMALEPTTEFAVEQYSFAGKQDGQEKAVFNLVRGALRTITGLIGHLNRQTYQVRTPTSTVGIRGTFYALMSCTGGACLNADGSVAGDGVYGTVHGRGSSVSVTTNAEYVFNAEETFHAPAANQPVQGVIAPVSYVAQFNLPSAPAKPAPGAEPGAATTAQAVSPSAGAQSVLATQAPPPPLPLTVVTTEARTSTGASAVLPITGVTGFIAQYAISPSAFDVISDCSTNCQTSDASQFTVENNVLTTYLGPVVKGSLGAGSVVDAGTATIAGAQFGWGRWVGNFTVKATDGNTYTNLPSGLMFGFTNDPNVGSGVHVPLPTSGAFVYSFVGGPNPVDTAGNVGTMTSMTGSASFSTTSASAGVTMNINMNIPNMGLAQLSAGGGGTISTAGGTTQLGTAPLGWTCSSAGTACAGGTTAGTGTGLMDIRFAGSKAQAMVVNGALLNAVNNSTNTGSNSVLFLNLLQCVGC